MPRPNPSVRMWTASHPMSSVLWSAALLTSVAMSASAAEYANKVLSDTPKAYYRFNDDTARTTVNKNSGSLGAAGNASHDLGTVHSFPGAIVGDANRASFFDFTSRTEIPWNAALNQPNTQPFTVEAWFYPASDQINGGQCPINNRYAYSGVNRQGWVFFQRNPNSSYDGKPGSEGIGWNFRMYRGSGGSSGLDITSGVPYEIGKWTHVVVVYDPVDDKHATARMYIDGVEAATKEWASETDLAYAPNTNDHPGAEAPNGPASIALGNYNNTASSLNPFFGAVDEFAVYPTKLTPEQIASHYQNATNANRTVSYSSLIQSHNPTAYLRLDEMAPGPDVAINLGDLRADGIATHTEEVRHPASSAIAGSTGDGSAAYHYRNGKSTTTMPFKLENNPNAGDPFTFETWIRPMTDRQGGQCPVNNRWVGGTGRTGWVIFQRLPNKTYEGVPGVNNEGHGWNFRMYSGAGNSGQDVITGTDYTVGEWQHLVVTWEPQTQNGDVGSNGNDQWEGILTAYFNGVPVATNSAARYSANRAESETGSASSDLAIGSYNAASGIGSNPFEGDVDELAIYNKYLLTPEQILEHYQAGTNRLRTKNYETLVLTAATADSGDQRKGPKTYLRFNDPAFRGASNDGTVASATGNLVLATDPVSGPQSPAFAGFEANNAGLSLDGLKQFASLNNPSALDIVGQITLEAWVKPGATQSEVARIISHGPPTLSEFLNPSPETNGAPVSAHQVFLRIDNASANYTVGSSDGTNTYSATAAIPAGDYGAATWVHLVGTYDGSKWNLYRNGVQIASTSAPVGAVSVPDGDWAIGSSGNGWSEPFLGGVDEVAIYDRALTADQVQAHFQAATTGIQPITLSIQAQAGAAVISYSGGALQESTTVNGAYSDVDQAKSPYTVPAGTSAKFYRVRQ